MRRHYPLLLCLALLACQNDAPTDTSDSLPEVGSATGVSGQASSPAPDSVPAPTGVASQHILQHTS